MSTIREVQECGLEILNEVVRICNDNHITYYLAFGTLLGAERHKGFIPWDNDIDIEMPVEDFRKFIKIAPAQLKKEYFLQTFISDPGYNEVWAKVRKNGTTSLPIAWKGLKIHWGIGIDIFPLTGISERQFIRELQSKSLSIVRLLIAQKYIEAVQPEEIEKNWKLRTLYKVPLRLRLGIAYVLINALVFKDTNKSRLVGSLWDIERPLRIKAYGGGKQLLFEGAKYQAPEYSKHVLKEWYGEWRKLPPENKRGNGHELTLGTIIYECNKDYKEYMR